MKIAVIGVGHVGLVTAATLAKIGNEVVGFDDDVAKIEALDHGRAPFFEPGLQELLDEVAASGRLVFAASAAQAIPGADAAFVCVGTPGRADGEANLSAVESAARAVATHATTDMVVVGKSTVPVQTGESTLRMLKRHSSHQFHVVSNPEFLREGSAVPDSLYPTRILVGADTDRGHEVMRELYAPMIRQGVRYFATDLRTAELAKHACNAFLALKLSYINALARICEAAGADVSSIAEIMGSDARIGPEFLKAGLGYGGYCLPKDVAAFGAQALKLGYQFALLDEVRKINDEAIDATFRKVKEAVWNLEGKRIVLLGLAFKPGTDDVRESPALRLAQRLLDSGAKVIGFDPQANSNAAAEVPGIAVADDPYQAAEGADCIVICTDWPEFRDLDLARLKGVITQPVIVDGRNLLSPESVADAGFTYLPTGRPPVNL